MVKETPIENLSQWINKTRPNSMLFVKPTLNIKVNIKWMENICHVNINQRSGSGYILDRVDIRAKKLIRGKERGIT